MKFEVIKQVRNCRTGEIVVGNHTIQTPCCLLYTRGGAIPHLVYDLFRSIKNLPSAVHLSLSSLTDQPGTEVIECPGNNGLMEFLGLEDFISYLSIQDPIEQAPEGYNEDKTVSVWTPGGRKKIDMKNFLAVLQTFKPTIAECLCDSIPATNQSEKRIRKSVDRSLKFLDECIAETRTNKELASCNIFGVIEGSDSERQRLRSARETSQRSVSGFTLESFDSSVYNWHNLLQKTMDVLPPNKPRLTHGVGTPEEVILAVECGIDIFDTCYPYQVTERGCALDIRWNKKRFKPELSYTIHASKEGLDIGMEDKLRKSTEESISDLDNHNGTENQCPEMPYEIDLNNSRYANDFTPIVTGCTCYSCINHTRAYVNHLLVTKEMLAKVLLMMHNFHEYFQFFESMRLAIKKDTFEEFKANILTENS